MTFFRFPHTPHLVWLADGRPRNDKVLSFSEARDLLAHDVIVEEKVDGANIGFSVGGDGALRVQSRGSYLDPETSHPQFKPLFRWLATRRHALIDALSEDLILFGEWCYAIHSIAYTNLPDWFLAFDVYDRPGQCFWSVARRNELARELDVEVVPRVASGRFDLQGLVGLLGKSKIGSGPAEGLYVRCDERDRLTTRAKVVRAEFVQSIDTHWTRGPLRINGLASDSRPRMATEGRRLAQGR